MLSKEKTSSNILNILQKKYKLKIEKANFANGYIPSYILLDRTRNIHSYLVPVSKEIADILTDYLSHLKEYYKVQYSQLDRPLFLLFENDDSIDFLDISNLKKYLKNEEPFNQFLENKITIDLIYPIIRSEL